MCHVQNVIFIIYGVFEIALHCVSVVTYLVKTVLVTLVLVQNVFSTNHLVISNFINKPETNRVHLVSDLLFAHL